MGRVYVAGELNEGVENLEPVARFSFGAVYFFLYEDFQELRDATGQMIDPQANAFFSGEQLLELERWLVATFERAICQSSEWDQRVGTQQDGDVIYQRTSRNDVVAFLRQLAGAARMARERNEGVLFWGE